MTTMQTAVFIPSLLLGSKIRRNIPLANPIRLSGDRGAHGTVPCPQKRLRIRSRPGPVLCADRSPIHGFITAKVAVQKGGNLRLYYSSCSKYVCRVFPGLKPWLQRVIACPARKTRTANAGLGHGSGGILGSGENPGLLSSTPLSPLVWSIPSHGPPEVRGKTFYVLWGVSALDPMVPLFPAVLESSKRGAWSMKHELLSLNWGR
jgi:hypothetical protein